VGTICKLVALTLSLSYAKPRLKYALNIVGHASMAFVYSTIAPDRHQSNELLDQAKPSASTKMCLRYR
jgi:hypothetical protein